ncbi:unnamed protein product, partial [Arabidopsis halleri]
LSCQTPTCAIPHSRSFAANIIGHVTPNQIHQPPIACYHVDTFQTLSGSQAGRQKHQRKIRLLHLLCA